MLSLGQIIQRCATGRATAEDAERLVALAPSWVEVGRALPKMGEDVLVCFQLFEYGEPCMDLGHIDADGKFYYTDTTLRMEIRATHWMRLPPLPAEVAP